jgi:hypothetical protein
MARLLRSDYREVAVQPVDPRLDQFAGMAVPHRGPLVVDDRAGVTDQVPTQVNIGRRRENACHSAEFGHRDGLDAGALPRVLKTLKREENDERQHHREHRADDRQRSRTAWRVGEPATFRRASADEKFGGDGQRDDDHDDDRGEPRQHG